MAIDGDRWKWQMRAEQMINRGHGRGQRRVREWSLGVHRRKTGCDEQHIPRPQWHIETLRQAQQHVAAGRSAAGFNETQVTRGNVRFARERKLAQMAPLPPLAEKFTDTGHGRTIPQRGASAITSEVIDSPTLLAHDDDVRMIPTG